MPTGYTAIIEDGDGCTFEEYVWRCARGMGAAVMMRDTGLDAPITDQAVVYGSAYSDQTQAKAEARLAALAAMTSDEATEEARKQHAKASADKELSDERERAKFARYAAMRAKVDAWAPPTPDHAGLKSFMLQQIGVSTEFGPYIGEMPTLLTGPEWLEQEREFCARDIKYARESSEKNNERDRERLAWVRALRASVPQPPSEP